MNNDRTTHLQKDLGLRKNGRLIAMAFLGFTLIGTGVWLLTTAETKVSDAEKTHSAD